MTDGVFIPPILIELAERETLAMDRIADALEALVIHFSKRSESEEWEEAGGTGTPPVAASSEVDLSGLLLKDQERVRELIEISNGRHLEWSNMGGRWFFDNKAISEYQRRHLP